MEPAKLDLVRSMLRKGINSPPTSSMGRLFDAVSAMAGLRSRATYEAQAAIELEMAADEAAEGAYPFDVLKGNVVDPAATVRGVAEDVRKGAAVAAIAGKFHNAVARMVLSVCGRVRRERGLGKIALTGGVFQNSLLLRKILEALSAGGFEVFWHRQVPPNDGGISLGQAVVANWRFRCA